jgi:signal transduction histidine kinase
VSVSLATLSRNPWFLDAVLAAALSALSLLTLAAGARDIGSYRPESIVLLFLQTVPLVFLRHAPATVLLVTGLATAGHAMQAEGSLNSTLGALIALFAVADRYDRLRSALAAIALGVMMGLLVAFKGGLPAALGSLFQTGLAVLVAWTLGTWARERRRYLGTVEDRAARAEQEREERALRAVTEERDRIARELHDIVTHHVSVIVIQAGAALRALHRRPDDAARAVEAIDATGRLALADMRRMLGILGGASGSAALPAAGSATESEPLEPLPRLDRLGQLIESVRAAGLPVELSVEGQRRPLDPGIELSAYRIVQEALTNTMKHAAGARARVTIRYEAAALEVRVADDGAGIALAGADSGGRGLIGMRERVALFGGTLETGPDGRGFRVAARLPLQPETTAAPA